MLADVSAAPEARQLLSPRPSANRLTLLDMRCGPARSSAANLSGYSSPSVYALPIHLAHEFIIFGEVKAEAVESIVDEAVLPALRARGASV